MENRWRREGGVGRQWRLGVGLGYTQRLLSVKVETDLRTPHPLNVIYDIGSNNGDDISYYLLKADKVVAVEANPILCEKISARFSKQIETNRLHVENCVITSDSSGLVDLHVNTTNHLQSSLIEPGPQSKDN